MKTTEQRKAVSVILAVLIFPTLIYFEGEEFEFQRLFVGLIGVFEILIIFKGFKWLDQFSIDKKWKTPEITLKKIGFSIGLFLVILAIDRLVNYTLTNYNLDYKVTWTIIIPTTLLVVYIFKALDRWAYENEQNDRIRGT